MRFAAARYEGMPFCSFHFDAVAKAFEDSGADLVKDVVASSKRPRQEVG